MKLASLLFLLIFISQAMAGSLSQAFDEFQYDLEVGWDQKDQRELNSIMDKFTGEVTGMIASGNISNTEFNRIVAEKIPDMQKRKALAERMHLMKGTDAQNITQFLFENREALGTKGASWNGEEVLPYIYMFAGIAAVAYLAILWGKHIDKECEANPYKCATPERQPDHYIIIEYR